MEKERWDGRKEEGVIKEGWKHIGERMVVNFVHSLLLLLGPKNSIFWMAQVLAAQITEQYNCTFYS